MTTENNHRPIGQSGVGTLLQQIKDPTESIVTKNFWKHATKRIDFPNGPIIALCIGPVGPNVQQPKIKSSAAEKTLTSDASPTSKQSPFTKDACPEKQVTLKSWARSITEKLSSCPANASNSALAFHASDKIKPVRKALRQMHSSPSI
jgi:hypothetical protein